MTVFYRIEVSEGRIPEDQLDAHANTIEELLQELANRYDDNGDETSISPPVFALVLGVHMGYVNSALIRVANGQAEALQEYRQRLLQLSAAVHVAIYSLDKEIIHELSKDEPEGVE